eukprot:897954-Rhodomonas_salina.2
MKPRGSGLGVVASNLESGLHSGRSQRHRGPECLAERPVWHVRYDREVVGREFDRHAHQIDPGPDCVHACRGEDPITEIGTIQGILAGGLKPVVNRKTDVLPSVPMVDALAVSDPHDEEGRPPCHADGIVLVLHVQAGDDRPFH